MVEDPPHLSEKEAIVLHLLVARGTMYGLELVADSEGKLKRGTVYVTLSRMTDKGYVTSYEEEAPAGEQGPPRRKYKVTGLGERAIRAQRAMVASWRRGMVPT